MFDIRIPSRSYRGSIHSSDGMDVKVSNPNYVNKSDENAREAREDGLCGQRKDE